MRAIAASALSLLACLNFSPAKAADFFYQDLAAQVAGTYGSGWSVLVPFTGLPVAADDPNRQGQTYPGHLWNFAVSPGSGGGRVFEHVEMYCPGQNIPKPFDVPAAPFRDFQRVTQFGATGDITVSGATPDKVLLKLSAIDAQYLKSVTATGTNVRRMYLPGANVLKSTVSASVSSCGPNFRYAIASVLYGKITLSVIFDRKLDLGIAATIAARIAANLSFKSRVIRTGSADKPFVIESAEPLIFAVKAVPISSLR
ncbi:hypothetical protein [Bradyrhizobium sp. cf659]|uniref:hypothetical protein n=1 Tax=Bradyrhizobium sp. cf659 TaxID=1761771 RepID=UPI0008E7BC22|nr:hypothetical protein [Bradyrhizobium sp. cf659]SFJ19552.1 hypothetical protein SAMN04487925_105383 [Bradyrhizobium sp. cf659]